MEKLTKKLVPVTLALVGSLAGCAYNQPNNRKGSASVQEAMSVLMTNQPQFIVHLPFGYKSLRNEEAILMRLAGIDNESISVRTGENGRYVFEGSYNPNEDVDHESALNVMRAADKNRDFVITPIEVKILEKEMYKQYSK